MQLPAEAVAVRLETHLPHAIGRYARSLYPGTRVRYVSSEEFTNEFVDSIRDGRADAFRKRYRDGSPKSRQNGALRIPAGWAAAGSGARPRTPWP